jgi:hypothetical protein
MRGRPGGGGREVSAMTTGEQVLQRAISLAETGTGHEQAVDELLGCCSGRRVAAVIARRSLQERVETSPDDRVASTALGFVDDMLGRDVWDVA